MELIKQIQEFLSYWYVRYLLATELYMVETWEKVAVLLDRWKAYFSRNNKGYKFPTGMGLTWMKLLGTANMLFATLFGLFWYFNYSIVMSGIAQLRSTTTHVEQIS